jgi:hypothetical protein
MTWCKSLRIAGKIEESHNYEKLISQVDWARRSSGVMFHLAARRMRQLSAATGLCE